LLELWYLVFMAKSFDAIVYCDASVRRGKCGFGVCLLDSNGVLIKKVSRRVVGYSRNVTALEGRAVCESIALAVRHGFSKIRVYTDSKALVQAAATGRGRSAVVKEFVEIIGKLRGRICVSIKWVRGHAGHKWNCMCDYLAGSARWTVPHFLAFVSDVLRAGKPSERILLPCAPKVLACCL